MAWYAYCITEQQAFQGNSRARRPFTIPSLTGIGGTAGSLGGMAFPLITGAVLDKFTNGYAIIFGFCSVAYLIAFAVNHLLAPKFEPFEA